MKTIFYRKTRSTERFKPTDLFIAWVQGEAAGAMAPTVSEAIQIVTDEHPGEFFAPHPDTQSS